MAVKNINDLNLQADALLPDNNQQLISPADIRDAIKDLNDSAVNRLSDVSSLGLKAYNPARSYQAGEGVFHEGVIYEALEATSGAFNSEHWIARSSSSGTWGSIAGTLSTQTDLQDELDAKQDVVSANLPLYKSGNVLNIQQAGPSQNGYLTSSDWAAFNSKENAVSVLSPLVRTGDTIEVPYVSDTQDGVLSSENWISLNSSGFIEGTYDEILTEFFNQTLVKGKYYKIQGGTRLNEGFGTRGDIILVAVDVNRFGTQGYLLTQMPSYELIGTTIVEFWTPEATPSADDKYIYNASVYKNLTGDVGTEPDADLVNWELISLSDSGYYKTELDQIEYEIVNDWISYRADKRGNRFLFSRLTSEGVFNGIDSFQWGNDLNFGNIIDNGVLNNLNDPGAVTFITQNNWASYKSLATSVNRTYTFPDADGTVALIGDITGDFLPSSDNNYIIVKASGTQEENGATLVAAVEAAKLLNPNGGLLSESNRAVVYILAGYYTVMNGDNGSPIVLGQFVDLVGIGDAKDIIIDSNTSNLNAPIQIEDSNNYVLKNFTLRNAFYEGVIQHNAGQTDNGKWEDLIVDNSYSSDVALPTTTEGTIWAGSYKNCKFQSHALNGSITGIVENCEFKWESCGFTNSGNIEISGTIKNCTAEGGCFGTSWDGDVTISGLIENCKMTSWGWGFGSAYSGNCAISGTIKECQIYNEGYSFGYTETGTANLTSTGVIENCKAVGSYCFISGNTDSLSTVSGLIKNCKATGNRNFASTQVAVTVDGVIDGCESTEESFAFSAGGNVIIEGTIKNCIGEGGCFGTSWEGNVIIASTGVIENCKDLGWGYSFGLANEGYVEIAGKIENCIGSADGYSFGVADSTGNIGVACNISGIIRNCSAGNLSFGAIHYGSYSENNHIEVTTTGLIENCIGGSDCFVAGYTTALSTMAGTIKNCKGVSGCFGNLKEEDILLVSGTIQDCEVTDNSGFGNSSFHNSEENPTGKLIRCRGLNINTPTWYGTIENCVFSGESKIKVGDDAKLRYNTIVNTESGDVITSFDETSSVSIVSIHNAFNKAMNGLVTNLVATPYDVIDSNVVI